MNIHVAVFSFKLSDWWRNVAYLESRIPCPIHVSPATVMPRQNFRGLDGQLLLVLI